MQRIDLNGAWQGTCYREDGEVDFKFGGTVPGCVHTALFKENIIDFQIGCEAEDIRGHKNSQ